MYLSTAGKRHFSDIIETSRSILIEVYFLLHLMNEAKSKVTPKALETILKEICKFLVMQLSGHTNYEKCLSIFDELAAENCCT